jgi:type I restriction enzyme S subunit
MARKMKATGLNVIGHIPSTWSVLRLKDVLRQPTSLRKVVATQYVGLEQIAGWSGVAVPIAIGDAGLESAQLIREGSICFSKLRPYLAKALVADTGLIVTSELLVARPLRLIESAYLLYWLLSHRFIFTINDMVAGTKMPRVDWSIFAGMPVPLPNLDEQRRIAAWLDLQTTRIDKRRELLAKKRELLRDLRNNLIGETLASGLRSQVTTPTGLVDLPALPMGWQASHTKRLLRFITSGSRGWAEYYAEQGDIFLRIGNLTRETIDLDVSDLKYVALPAKAAEGKRTRLRPGDMLVSITADLGSIAVVPVLDKPAYVSQHIALCRPKEGVHPRWLGYAMVSPQAKRQLMNSGYGGTKIQLSLDDVRNVWLAVPPLDEQIEIADFLDQRLSKIARQITLIDQLDDLLKQQRKAIIHEAVTGKIDLSVTSQGIVEA